MLIAGRSLRFRSPVPPTTGSDMLNAKYDTIGTGLVSRRMPSRLISSDRPGSPRDVSVTAWSNTSELMSELS